MKLAPLLLFVYNRPSHTHETIGALKRNKLAAESELFIFSDGFKSDLDREVVLKVREYLKTISGFKTVTIIERENNLGLANSIITGVTEIVNRFGKVIVLEDDMLTSPYFLKFMNEALELYAAEEKVISIHGYVYPVQGALPSTFFLRGADCWGWATWKRGWDLFESDGRKLLSELDASGLKDRFDFDGTYGFSRMLQDQVNGANNSWAIRWNASAYVKDKLTLYPGRSLVYNTGIDASGTHCGDSEEFATVLSQKPITIGRVPLEEDLLAREAFKIFFRSLQLSLVQRTVRKFRTLWYRRL